MLDILREIQTPEKSYSLTLCDLALQPLNILFGKRKVVHCGKTWAKVTRTSNVAYIALAYIGTLLLSPIVCIAFFTKASMQEHRQLSKRYYFEKIEALLQDRGIVIKSVNRREPDTFSFNIERKNPLPHSAHTTLWVEFTCFGKMKYKKLFEQAL